jgi:glycerol uptake facilitator-like aquaporin
MQQTIARRVTAEAVGTCLLLAAVVGSGIMGERLAGGNVAAALLANTMATGAALVAVLRQNVVRRQVIDLPASSGHNRRS